MPTNTTATGHDLCGMTAAELGALYRHRVVSPVEAVDETLARVDRLNPQLGAYLSVYRAEALQAAEAARLQLDAGVDLGPLHGIPVSVKDIIDVAGWPTTAASRMLMDAKPASSDAVVVRRLRKAGAIIIGKTNLAEFAHGDRDPDAPFPIVENPRKIGRFAGSSSSGSAAAVAAGLGVLSVGTQTGGSILNPAAMCGVTGLKPTYGLVPRSGIVPVSYSLDHVGLIARSVLDLAVGLAAVAGYDPSDPYSAIAPMPDVSQLVSFPVRPRIGVPTNALFSFGSRPAVRLLKQTYRTLTAVGMDLIEVNLPRAEEMSEVLGTIASAELATYHRRYRGRERMYGRDMRARLRVGRSIDVRQYIAARHAQDEIRRLWHGLFDTVEAIALPENTVPAPRHGETMVEVGGRQYPVLPALSDFNRPASLVGLPSITQPIGLLPDGSPIGVQFVGRPFGEATLLNVGARLEAATGLPQAWGIDPRQ